MDSQDSEHMAMELLQSLMDDKSQLESFIVKPQGLIFDDLGRTQRHFRRIPDPSKLFSVTVTPLNTKLKVERDLKSGAMLGFYEVETSHVGETSKTSTSMQRAPGPATHNVKGSSTNFPFWPGGMNDPSLNELVTLNEMESIDFKNDLETVPPGFDRGVIFDIPSTELNQSENGVVDDLQLVNEISIVKLLDDPVDNNFYASLDSQREKSISVEENEASSVELRSDDETSIIISDIAPKISAFDVLNISQEIDQTDLPVAHTDWAEVVNVKKPVANFHSLVPSMARTWPFELDSFQKQAIICLEKHDSVFVAAHTSAGKTVVAEYAVALSLRHMTKTIYTSPIKALSNQKFRDFKNIFKDVGLITGDVQINSEASCLIMTTEILRSMLYNGSDTIRDVEWVIFDEVHYINDAERGVVWEEVLILLPNHINIVLLSATVPNALDFADWIGRTKRKKIYVISTPKRPVPLEHYLYCSNNVKSQNELYTVVNAEGKFSIVGYNAAKEAHEGKKNNAGAKSGSTAYPQSLNAKQECTMWLKLLNLLKKKEQLPVVAFTLSRKMCDQNAQLLTSVDLTTSSEKNKIHEFVLRSMNRLKTIDRGIPQVKIMQDLLKRGIGIHHSGILPILKEVVEMLFQEGLVKLLFATETFAMGVNMPARTVVFDSITKYDGSQRRNLRPEEYIQMAGRAGRRGLDEKGTVIILCKMKFPERSDLELMIQGKPTTLESRFRLTYSMILNLMRVEKLRVEEMMKRSFSEIGIQKNAFRYQKRLEMLGRQASSFPEVECTTCGPVIEEYYNACHEYVRHLKDVQTLILNHPHGVKILSQGRIVVVATKAGLAALGIILKVKKHATDSKPSQVIEVLTVEGDEPKTKQSSNESTLNNNLDSLFVHILNAQKINVYVPQMAYRYNVISCSFDDIIYITRDDLHIDGEKVFKDWDKRQIPRFRDDPPNQSFKTASQELIIRLQDPRINNLESIDPTKDLHIKDVDICEKWTITQACHQLLNDYPCIDCKDVQNHLKLVYDKRKVKEDLKDVRYRLSDDSLQLLPEYKARVMVLKQLHYIDDLEMVLLKGRVACEISNHELVTTELVFENILAKFQPEEMAALLSCMVCQEKRRKDSEVVVLPENLSRGVEEVKKIIQTIGEMQRRYNIHDNDFEEQFRFELVDVVYEWAKGMPFAEIMSMTDTQEGIIVRCIQRLDEILRDVKDGARIVGDPILYKKAEAASQAIKRDIVFAASLYTQ